MYHVMGWFRMQAQVTLFVEPDTRYTRSASAKALAYVDSDYANIVNLLEVSFPDFERLSD